MIFKSGMLVGPVSGKLGGLVASHNNGGQYLRQKVTPTNPNSPAQQEVRTLFAELAARWRDNLNQTERDAWEVYAFNSPIQNRIGDTIKISGLAMYIRSNVPRLQAGMSRIDTAPIIFGLAAQPATAAVIGNPPDIDISWTAASEPWDNEVGAALLVYVSRPVNPSIAFFKGPFRFAGTILGALVAPTSPQTITPPFTLDGGTRFYVKLNVTRADGRLSDPLILTNIQL